MLHRKPCHVNGQIYQKYLGTFLTARTYRPTLFSLTLRTKSDIRTRTLSVKHHVNIQVDKNIRIKMHESKRRTKLEKFPGLFVLLVV